MSVSSAQALATMRYAEKNYDKIDIRVKKGKREYYKQEAAKRGLSLAMLFQKGVEEYLENHQPEQAAE